jgi:hypothetical protein
MAYQILLVLSNNIETNVIGLWKEILVYDIYYETWRSHLIAPGKKCKCILKFSRLYAATVLLRSVHVDCLNKNQTSQAGSSLHFHSHNAMVDQSSTPSAAKMINLFLDIIHSHNFL